MVLSRPALALASRRQMLLSASRRGFTHSTWIAGFPRTRIPFVEKVAHGVAITIGSLIVPVWVLTHLDDYKK